MSQSALAPFQVQTGLIISLTMEPIPPKRAGPTNSSCQFVEIQDLLPENVALQQQLDAMSGGLQFPPIPDVTCPRLQEVNSVTS